MTKRKWTEAEVDEYRRKHNSYWFYYNKEDANLFVPRADPLRMWSITGMTFNWAHPVALIFALAVITAAVFYPIWFNIKYGR